MTRVEAEKLLNTKFNLSKFHDRQWETIEKLLHGKRVLLIEKTGFGKSLCFQFSAIILPGITVVFSPLIALMRDQVKKLLSLGIPAACINSEQTPEENLKIIEDAKLEKIKILYIAPERQENSEWLEATRELHLAMVVVDEAHCISVWGHDFRPAFRRIINLVNLLPKGMPVLAATATATIKVQKDIERQISGEIEVVRGNLMRPNLKLFVIKVGSDEEKMIWIGKNLQALPGSGLIYSGTRVDTEIYTRWLESVGVSAIGYNAGLDTESRMHIEDGLMKNTWKCIISTNALGMGIDKSDIRFIIHTQTPQSPIHYYQEIGRAGRDGKPAYIILFYKDGDRKLPEAFIEGGRPAIKKYESVIRALKLEMLGERDLMRITNLKKTQIRVIKADLIDQGIIRQLTNRKFEYVVNAPALNTKAFQDLRDAKTQDLEKMIAYINTDESRMKYLCEYLGDTSISSYSGCDNTNEKKLQVIVTPEWESKLAAFRENYFPVLDVAAKGSNMVNGIAASYYGFSNVGTAIHNSKYEGAGDFPDFLVRLTIKAFYKAVGKEQYDVILFVPPTVSGDLVKNFALKLSQSLKIDVSFKLKKAKPTKEQKVFENSILKSDNVRDAFTYSSPEELEDKKVIVIDDIFDSGASMKEIGRYLTGVGAAKIFPLVIAKTVGGDVI